MKRMWLVLFGFAVLLSGTAVAAASGVEWPGFRGQEHQGVGTADSSPTRWSPTEHVQWKARVPGVGHSSPVVTAQHIFVTTAYETEGTQTLLRVARRFRLGCAVVALVLWLLLPARVGTWQEALAGAVVSVFVLLTLADEQIFNFSRSAGRNWLGAAPAALTGLAISAYGLQRASWTRRVIGVAMGLTTALVVAGMPGGLEQEGALRVALPVIAVAGVIGCGAVLLGTFSPAAKSRFGSFSIVALLVLIGSVALAPLTGRSPAVLVGIATLLGVGGRAVFGPTARLFPAWRGSVLVAAAIGFLTNIALVPRSGVVHAVVCLDRSTGDVVWIREGLRATRTPVHRTNSRATPTPVTDGQRVFAYFGTPGLMAVGVDGRVIWTKTDVPFHTIYGVGASPVLAHDLLIVSSFTPSGPYLVAINASSGKERWRTSRPSVDPEFGDSRTPVVHSVNGRPTVIVWGRRELAGHDLSTGTLMWQYSHDADHRTGSMVTSLIAKDDFLYLPLENGMIALSLERLAARQDPVVWTSAGGGSRLTTPVLHENLIFAVSGAGIASSTDALTGKLMWRVRLAGEFYSSPVVMASKVFFTNESGTTTVVAAGPVLEQLARNDLDEPVTATIAPVGGYLYLRGHHNLYSIGR